MKRIEVLDGLRGFALLGILLVNINFFNESLMAISFGGLPVEGSWNQVIKSVSTLFVEGKFIIIILISVRIWGSHFIFECRSSRAKVHSNICKKDARLALLRGFAWDIHLARGYFDKLCIGRPPTFTIHTAEP